MRMTARAFTFCFPMPENIANGRMHWRVKYNKRQEYYETCDLRLAAGMLPPAPKEPLERAMASVTMYLGAAMDDDNAGARLKWVWDWLKTRGYIVDDRKKVISQLSYPRQIVKRDGNYRVVVNLTELEMVA